MKSSLDFSRVNRICRDRQRSEPGLCAVEGCAVGTLHKGHQAQRVSGAEIQPELCSLSGSLITRGLLCPQRFMLCYYGDVLSDIFSNSQKGVV